MSKKVIIEALGKEFTLEFDRSTIIYTETVLGFSMSGYEHQPHTMMYRLFAGAMHKHHAIMSNEERLNVFDAYINEGGDLAELNSYLIDAYSGFSLTTQPITKTLKRV